MAWWNRHNWGVLCEIVLTCGWMVLAVRLLPLPRLIRTSTKHPQAANVTTVCRCAAAVFRRYPFCAMSCLTRTLVLLTLLKRRGVAAIAKVGLAKTGTLLQAHAWLEQDGVPLLDDALVGTRFDGVVTLARIP